jgi:hypothetical protein
MQPQNKRDGYQSKWRVFHPQATVWVMNPFDHDVVFNVADEHNSPFQYRMPALKTSELPGGAVATLGVKAIVDELIQNDPKDIYSMWEVGVREKHEKKIILRVKDAPTAVADFNTGEVNLGTSTGIEEEPEEETVKVEVPVFPQKGSKRPVKQDFASVSDKQDTVIEE